MARTANVFARVEPEVKEQAEQVLDRLGIPMSNAVGMFLRQIVLQRGIPFEMKLPAYEEPVAYGSLTKEQFIEKESAKTDSLNQGKSLSKNGTPVTFWIEKTDYNNGLLFFINSIKGKVIIDDYKTNFPTG